MLDYLVVFSKGGALLWAFQMAALKGDPVNALVRTFLLEERSGEASFNYTPPAGAPYTLKWTMHNGLELVFVAVYQKALKLCYVDELLKAVKREFAAAFQQHGIHHNYADFDDVFRQQLKRLEQAGDVSMKGNKPAAKADGNGRSSRQNGAARSGIMDGQTQENGDADGDGDSESSNERVFVNNTSANGHAKPEVITTTDESPEDSHDDDANINKAASTAFNKDLVKKLSMRRKPGMVNEPKKKVADYKGKKRGARTWDEKKPVGTLDFSNAAEVGGPEAARVDYHVPSRVDVDEDPAADYAEQLVKDAQDGGKGAPTGVLASFVRTLGVNVLGTQALTQGDIQPALDAMKRKLMERNVAEEIAEKLCESVAAGIVGKKLGSFTRVSSAITCAFEAALTRILTPKRSVDVLRDVRAQKAKGEPYVVVFVGVNGVGKSTNLAKVAYWLGQHDISVMIAACDTFRSGAVEQLKTHCNRLGVPLYERGYEKDPAKIAMEAVRAAREQRKDVVLVDTAGRMQGNEPLMRALSNLINVNRPNLVLFVGEALVGNDAVDQLTKFNERLADLATTPTPHTIDGIVLTKFDTIDDKVGAALSMVYTSGAPIMFVGCGQTYVDLKKLNVKQVVQCLLK